MLSTEEKPHIHGLNGRDYTPQRHEPSVSARIALALEAIDQAAPRARKARALRKRQFTLEGTRHELTQLYEAREDQFWKKQSELFGEIERLGSQIATFRKLAHKLETGEDWLHG
jgi:hypothetical protein